MQKKSYDQSLKAKKVNLLTAAVLSTALMIGLPIPVTMSADHHAKQEPVNFKRTKITSRISLLQGSGGNIAVLSGPEGFVVVDTDYDKHSAALELALAKLRKNRSASLAYVINTHWHGDHSGGNKQLGVSAPIIAHENVRRRLESPQEIKFFNMKSDAYPSAALPSLTYQTELALHFAGEAIQLVHFPNGHTDGDSVVFFKNANVLHTGDLFFNGFFPFIDIDSNGNVLKLVEHIATLLELIDDKTVVIPGHGKLATKAELQSYLSMLKGSVMEVKIMHKSGMSLSQMQRIGLSDKWDSWAKGFIPTDRWIEFIFKSL